MKTTVVGAGVVGLSCGYEIAALGHHVAIIDAGAVGAGASAGNAGWVTPFLSVPRAAPGVVRDAVRNVARTDGPARIRPHLDSDFAGFVGTFLRASRKKPSSRAAAALQAMACGAHRSYDALRDRGVEFEQFSDGLVVVFKHERNLVGYERHATRMRSLGYVGGIRSFRGGDLVAFEPAIRRDVAGALHLETERHVRPESLTQGLAKALLSGGGEVYEHECLTQVRRANSGQWVARTERGRQVVSDNLVLAAGYLTKQLLATMGVRLPMEAAKGTSVTANGEGTVPSRPLKLYEDMVACSPFGPSVRLSGTFDLGDRGVDVNRQRLDMVVRKGLSYLADWRPTKIETAWVGHRPTTADDLPVIGAVPGHPGLYVATGHGTLGVTLGPLTGALAAKEIARGEEQPLLAPFRISRFWRTPLPRF